ncbi:3-dehydroquinate synthase [Geoalkalibacter subterraneus]|uniref:3-dehydroquinate synthase n=1 Tax=Geoalkalibacter subterraneus TaxID=483547 RepID=A0A0B5FPT9_9BACT|nr:3-dehydroquinate synthase [Geoalkalibacter subterraneus]AJF06060.1 3-dehydroquinate synthase [Geoalkalibacter subterraneus]
MSNDNGVKLIEVGLGERSYPIWIGSGVLPRLGEALKRVSFPRRIAVVTNETVAPLYGEQVLSALRQSSFAAELIVLPDGEEHKNLESLNFIFDELITRGFDRGTGLIALGGGVIGDLAGFAAATYLRGIPFVQVPTTLLAQVDSSVGGKTAINHRLGKNLVGAFYQPRHVHIDVDTLATLPEREFRAGCAEIVKYGVIRDGDFFEWLEDNAQRIGERDPACLIHAVRISCQIKADIVEIDEKEGGLRAILNYGHTLGHAVELLSGYGKVRHGEAVAIGMVAAATVSSRLGHCSSADVERIRRLLSALGLPVRLPDFAASDYLAALSRDKKVQDGRLRMIFNRGIGDCLIEDVADPERTIAPVLDSLRNEVDQ